MLRKGTRVFVGDFETTVFEGQEYTEVWASASVELNTDDVIIFHSIDDQWNYFVGLNCNLIVYYHNLKFDGSFWLPFFLQKMRYEQAYEVLSKEPFKCKWLDDKFMSNNSVKYSISAMGQWYTITVKVRGHYIEFRDSLKLLPFSVKTIGKSFQTEHKKLEMEYKGFRYAGCEITDEEKHYIANDVLVVKEALEIMFNEGHNKLTIGACCMSEFKRTVGKADYQVLFPDCSTYYLNKNVFGYATLDEYIRRSYRGGWCYLVSGKENKVYHNGTTADVNSLYPSMMSSESGNIYPYGKPMFWKGDYIPDEALRPNKYYFVRIKTRFYLKPNKLPFIQIKHNILYDPTEMLETSDVFNPNDGKYYTHYGEQDTRQEMVLTMTDYQLLKDHYDLVDFEILDGCYFCAMAGIFDEYIETYKQMKLVSTGAKRTLAKLYLNNLYGKLATSTDSSFKVAYIKDNGVIGFIPVDERDKKPVYIPCGSAITSYARNFTIRTAQANYYGKDKAGFIYADTDSIHCDLQPEELVNVPVHDKNFCCWKLESNWDTAIFTRQKTYIEHVTHEDLQPIENPYYNVKCAGMPDRCKQNFVEEMEQGTKELTDFKTGLKVSGKLLPKRINGGIVLVDTEFEMRG